jgi:multidrug efflux system membrane fusion protein
MAYPAHPAKAPDRFGETAARGRDQPQDCSSGFVCCYSIRDTRLPNPHWYLSPRSLIGLATLVLIAGYFGWRYLPSRTPSGPISVRQQQNKNQAPIPVTVQTVQASDFPVYLNGLGTVQPYNTVTVRSRVDGQVVKIGFRQGQMVKEGDLLVQIDPRPYQAALDQAQAKKAQDEASLKNAKLDFQRYSMLVQQNSVSRQQVDTQLATVEQLTAQIKGDQAAIDNAATQLSYTTIRSPLTGKTGFRLVDPGNIVHASDTTGIVTIVKLQPISVVFTAPENDIGKLNTALAAGRVPVTALSSRACR